MTARITPGTACVCGGVYVASRRYEQERTVNTVCCPECGRESPQMTYTIGHIAVSCCRPAQRIRVRRRCCRWCGQRFTTTNEAVWHCSPSCEARAGVSPIERIA